MERVWISWAFEPAGAAGLGGRGKARFERKAPNAAAHTNFGFLPPLHEVSASVGRRSDHSLCSEPLVTFEEDAGACDQKDAAGFIKINALRLRLLAMRDKRLKR